MRSALLISASALAGLWLWYAATVADAPQARPVAFVTPAAATGPSAEYFNNRGVAAFRRGQHGDALAYFERARDFRPHNQVIAANVAGQQARLRRDAWERMLGAATALLVGIAVVGTVVRSYRGRRERRRLRRLAVHGEPWLRVRPHMDQAELPVRFNRPVSGLLRRHPLTIVWSCSGQGKHMKSRPPVQLDDAKTLRVRLDEERLERLRRHPGDWKGFLYLGGTQVGAAAAKVG